MHKPKLYIFIGYPGAGKTTISKIITERTGAYHMWADQERHKLFSKPTHSQQESSQLYEQLNQAADYLLSQDKSVVFDTNFNFYKDRQKLKTIADKNNAEMILIWVTTPKDISKERAVLTHKSRNNYEMKMTNDQFDSIVSKLEPPTSEEQAVKIDGTNLNKQAVLDNLVIS